MFCSIFVCKIVVPGFKYEVLYNFYMQKLVAPGLKCGRLVVDGGEICIDTFWPSGRFAARRWMVRVSRSRLRIIGFVLYLYEKIRSSRLEMWPVSRGRS